MNKPKIQVSIGRRGISENKEEKKAISVENDYRRRNIEVQKKTNICLCGKDHGICVCGLDEHKSRIEVSRGRRGISEKQEEKRKIDEERELKRKKIEEQKKERFACVEKNMVFAHVALMKYAFVENLMEYAYVD
jgi:hypothetical protein